MNFNDKNNFINDDYLNDDYQQNNDVQKSFYTLKEYETYLGNNSISDHDLIIYKDYTNNKLIMSWNTEKKTYYLRRLKKKLNNINNNPILYLETSNKKILNKIESILNNLSYFIKYKYLLLINKLFFEIDKIIEVEQDKNIDYEIHLQECDYDLFLILNTFLKDKYNINGKYIEKDIGLIKLGNINNFNNLLHNKIINFGKKFIKIDEYEKIINEIITTDEQILNLNNNNKNDGFAIFSNNNFTMLPCFSNVIFANRNIDKSYNENENIIIGTFGVNVRGCFSFENKIINAHLKFKDKDFDKYDIKKEIISVYNSTFFMIGKDFNSQFNKYFITNDINDGINKIFLKIFKNYEIVAYNIENLTIAMSNILINRAFKDIQKINNNNIVEDFININTNTSNFKILQKKFCNNFEDSLILLGDFNMNFDLLLKNFQKAHALYEIYKKNIINFNIIENNNCTQSIKDSNIIKKILKEYKQSVEKYIYIDSILSSNLIDHILKLSYTNNYEHYNEINNFIKDNFIISNNDLNIDENNERIILSWNLQRNYDIIKKEKELYNINLSNPNYELLINKNYNNSFQHLISNIRWYLICKTIYSIIKNIFSKEKKIIICFENCENLVGEIINYQLSNYINIQKYKHINNNIINYEYLNDYKNIDEYKIINNNNNKNNLNLGYFILSNSNFNININGLTFEILNKNNIKSIQILLYSFYIVEFNLYFIKKKNYKEINADLQNKKIKFYQTNKLEENNYKYLNNLSNLLQSDSIIYF